MTLSLSSLEVTPLSNLFSPASQKASSRPISFMLVDGTQSIPTVNSLTLNIRPEELTRTSVSRATVQQTLGGAWCDDFGPGLDQITISGTTGWRGSTAADGMTLFASLKAQTYTSWHDLRNKARAAGKDPNLVTLTLADTLNSTTDVVIPLTFTLRRSRTRPLLMQYQISMVATGLPVPATTTTSALASALQSLGLTSLANSVTAITSAIATAAAWVATNIVAPVQAFLTTAALAFNAVISVINAGTSIISSVLSTAQAVARAGMTALQTLATIESLPQAIAAQVMDTASEFSNVYCVLKNAVSTASTYPDYTTLFGSSNCSSTAGGEAASTYTTSDTNPFVDVIGTASTPPIQVTATATTALQAINNSDPVLSPLSTTTLGTNLSLVSAGVTVAS